MSLAAQPRTDRSQYYLLNAVAIGIALRMVVDLSGGYDGEGLNAGGLYGAVILLVAAVALVFSKLRLDWGIITFCAALLIGLATLVAALAAPAQVSGVIGGGKLVEYTRVVIGFATFVPLIIVIGLSDDHWQRNFKIFYFAFLIFLCVPVVIEILQLTGHYPYTYFDYNSSGVRFGRPSGGYAQPNSLGRLLVFGILYTYMASRLGIIKSVTLKNIILLALFAADVLTTHRTSIVSAFVIIVLLEKYTFRLTAMRLGLIIEATIVLAIVAIVFLDRILESGALDIFTILFKDGGVSFRGRDNIWNDVFELLSSFDWLQALIGIGYQPFEAHNDFLRMIIVHGYIGLVLFCVVIFGSLIKVASGVDAFGRRAVIGLGIFFLFYATTLEPTIYPYFMWLFWLSLVYIAVLFKKPDIRVPDEVSRPMRDALGRPTARSVGPARSAASLRRAFGGRSI